LAEADTVWIVGADEDAFAPNEPIIPAQSKLIIANLLERVARNRIMFLPLSSWRNLTV
jgi:hypothetical protein